MTGRLAGWLFTMGNRKNKKKKIHLPKTLGDFDRII
jgi:hypothetical protein